MMMNLSIFDDDGTLGLDDTRRDVAFMLQGRNHPNWLAVLGPLVAWATSITVTEAIQRTLTANGWDVRSVRRVDTGLSLIHI